MFIHSICSYLPMAVGLKFILHTASNGDFLDNNDGG